ncbi:MAG: DnaK suppressor protein [Rhodothermales bacterium]
MSDIDLNVQRRVLTELEEELRRQVEQPDASATSVAPDNAIGRLTRMEALQAQQIGEAGKRRLKQRLFKVRKALESIDAGTYGQCVRCGKGVPPGRLQIMPETRVCVACSGR